MTNSEKIDILAIVKKLFGETYIADIKWIDSHVETLADDFTGKEYEETMDDEVVIRLKNYPDNIVELIEKLEDMIYAQYTGVIFSFEVDAQSSSSEGVGLPAQNSPLPSQPSPATSSPATSTKTPSPNETIQSTNEFINSK